MQPTLDCEACGALTPGVSFRYFADRVVCEVVCDACNHQNPQSRVHSVPREWLAPQTISLNFVSAAAIPCRPFIWTAA
jgi:hypothetical protein